MTIKTVTQTSIACDTCGTTAHCEAGVGRPQAITWARGDGWKIGKKVTCPECQKLPAHDK